MRVSVIGCGRWGSLIAWYLDRIGQSVSLYGRSGSAHFQSFAKTRSNGVLTLPESVTLTSDLGNVCQADVLLISVPSQHLRGLLRELRALLPKNKDVVLCMKGIEEGSGKRLSEIAEEELDPGNRVAVWLGPGHVQEFLAGIPNCMVIDSRHDDLKEKLIQAFSGDLIRFYYGEDLLGNEIGAATKNVIGIAAGILDGMGLSTLKGALMSRGTHEIAELIRAMGGNPFSPYSHNRQFGECIATGKPYGELAEGYSTAAALQVLVKRYGVELPICSTVYRILYRGSKPEEEIAGLFRRSLKKEWTLPKEGDRT